MGAPSAPLKDGEKGVVVQRDRGSYAIVPRLPCGMVTPDQLRRIADVAERFHCQAVKITSAQRIALIGLQAEQIDGAWDALRMSPGSAVGDSVRSVKACPGTTFCKRGQQDSLKLGLEVDRLYHGRKLPSKFKMGVSGCPNQCAETAIKDIGLVGSRAGWDVWVGGSGGIVPRLGVRLARQLTESRALDVIARLVDYYEREAKPKERFFKFVVRVGLDEIARVLDLPTPEAAT